MKAKRFKLSDLSDQVVDRLTEYSLYSSPAFAQLWHTQKGRDTYWGVEDRGRIVSVMTTVEFGHTPFRRMQAMPDGLFARLVPMSDDVDLEACSAVLFDAIRSAGFAKVYVTDFHHDLTVSEEFHQASSETNVVDISSPGWEPPDETLRSEIRKAEREGVNVQVFDQKRHLEGFLRLLRATEARLVRDTLYSDEFFASLSALAEEDKRVVWLAVEHDGQMAASHIYFRDGEHLLYWLSCFDKEFSFLKANQYMLFKTAIAARDGGVKYLNLGQSPAEAESLWAFKEKWGGDAYSYPLYTLRSLLGRMR